MSFPDQKYMNHVRDALWSRAGHASVMIGSGFSKYAQPARPDAGELPLWNELASAMFRKIHPQTSSGCQQSAPINSSDPRGALGLAQEYKDCFGRRSLHLFLQQQIRDGDFNPGEFHRRMLKLPWRDVFTTNWDTLLERTCLSVPERPYSVVHNKDEIPLSAQPRIIKLHGSLDGHYPLIVAEEDYCTYPQRHAPFVNTVQQAMMETVFCLIGFSGNDPNFLEWSTWVQNNLGESAPRIYVAGWLNFTANERDRFQTRNVIAIDLAHHPEAGRWPDHLGHQYATDWILRSLEGGQPYDVADWPAPATQSHRDPPPHLKPVEVVTSDSPLEEPWSPHTSVGSQGDEDPTHELLTTIWPTNRSLYPGWLVAPLEVRGSLISRTRAWESSILRALDNLSLAERVYAIRELAWRHEITLEPISSELESAAQDAMAHMIDVQTNDTSVELHQVSPDIREACREILLTLVTVARLRFDEDTFTRRIETAMHFLDDNADVSHRIHHERCLWSAWSLDFEALAELLADWKTENCDPMWTLRKAALLDEAGRDEEATKLTEQAVADIRRFPIDDRSVAGPSREGWAMWS
ncbi:MAG: SIR2 family protein, partial [Chloroflexi bacterium]|nr:SIR2 family protein [Chloroflexota bacterium]